MPVSHLADSRSAGRAVSTDTHPLVETVRRYADSVLKPAALHTERHGIPAERVTELAELGLLNHLAPSEFTGAAVELGSDRTIREILAGGCLNTWLLWAQHAPFVQQLAKLHAAGAPLPDLAQDILRGRILVGAGISDVRRYPGHYIAAERVRNGWTFSGTISWVTGWGLSEVLVVAGVEPSTDRVVTALVPVSERMAATPLDLAAVAGSRTQRVTLTAITVPDRNVLTVESLTRWRKKDLGMSSDAQSHHFGLAYAVLDELGAEADARARAVATSWRPRIDEIRSTAYTLADEVTAHDDGGHRVRERLAAKVAVGDALATLTRALLAARSGRGIGADDTAQLYARSALFLHVQGQSAEVRAAQLEGLAR